MRSDLAIQNIRLTSEMDSKQARAALQALKEAVSDGWRVRLLQTVTLIVRRLQIYPPPPPRSRYVRTYRFKNAWRVAEQPDGYSISNAVRGSRNRPYAAYVTGNAEGESQATIHAGRWPVFRDVVDDALDRFPLAILRDLTVSTQRPG